jgi:hypothetical protein
MRRTTLNIAAIALFVITISATEAFAQSLGDVARENREKKEADNTSVAPPKVITNKDLQTDPSEAPPAPASPTGSPQASSNSSHDPFLKQQPSEHSAQPHNADQPTPEQRAADQKAAQRNEQHYARQRLAEQRAADQWKRQIVAEKDKIAALQLRIDHLKATLQFADVSTYPYAGPYNRDQARQLQRITRLQEQQNEEQRKLDHLQDAARHAGMHTIVYDP